MSICGGIHVVGSFKKQHTKPERLNVLLNLSMKFNFDP